MKRAVFWVAWGQQYVTEAHKSAESVKRHMPDIDRVLWVRRKDMGRGGPIFDRVLGSTFNKRLKHAHLMLRGLRYRVDAIHQLTDYDQLLFLDTDTRVCAPVYDLFEALDRFDLMAALSAGRRSRKGGPSMPDAFPEYNSGVVPFRNDERVQAFHNAWYELYKEHRYNFKNSNQRSFREMIWLDKSGLKFCVLPTEYNCRFPWGMWVGKQVKILHGRAKDMNRVEAIINKNAGEMRAWKPWVLT